MTTRNETCKLYGIGAAGVGCERLEKLDVPEAVELLIKTSGVKKSQNNHTAHLLVGDEFLAHHALSIVHAGAFISQGFCKLDEYASMFKSQRSTLLSQHSIQASSEYGDVYATFEVSPKAIEASSKPEARDALELLGVLAHFHRDAVSEDIFTRAWQHSLTLKRLEPEDPDDSIRILSTWHVGRLRRILHPVPSTTQLDIFAMRKARGVLQSFSLVSVHPGNSHISMHPLVHTWARDRLEIKVRVEAWSTAAASLTLTIDSHWHEEYFDSIQPHVEFNLSLQPEETPLANEWSVLDGCRMFYHFAWLLYHRRNDVGAQHTLDIISSQECPEIRCSRNLRHILYISALCHRNLRNLDEHMLLMEQVVSLDKNVLRPEANDRLAAQRVLGTAQRYQGRYQEAIEVLGGILQIEQRTLSPNDPRLLLTKHELAAAYISTGSQSLRLSCLKRYRSVCAPTHSERLVSQHELARAYM